MQTDPRGILFDNRVLFLFGEIDEEAAASLIPNLFVLDSLGQEPIRLFLNTPGGSLDAGLAIYDTMQMIRSPIHTICIGRAASMGAWLLASGSPGHRIASENCRIMIHQGSTAVGGNYQELIVRMKEFDRVHKQMVDILSRHTKKSKEEIEAVLKSDYWLTPQEAVDFGIVDRVARARDT